MIWQLNLPAVERLIGGDSEIEVHLREQIVEEFAKKRLKTLLNDPLIHRIAKKVEEEIRVAIGEEVYDYRESKLSIKANAKIIALIQAAAKSAIDQAVQTSFDEVVKSHEQRISERINRYETRLLELVNNRVKEVLNAIETGLDKRLDEAFEKKVNNEVQRRLAAAASMG